MAKRTIVSVVDDIDGYEGPDVRTVTFSIEGATYEIELGSANNALLDNALEPFISAARPVAAQSGRARQTAKSGPAASAIRSWARENGLQVPDRGRIPSALREDFLKSQGA